MDIYFVRDKFIELIQAEILKLTNDPDIIDAVGTERVAGMVDALDWVMSDVIPEVL